MNALRPAAFHPDRLAPLLPVLFAALLFAGMAMQGKLLPVQPMRLEIPSGAGMSEGAAPQESLPPPSVALSLNPPPAVLPRDSVPDETAPAYSGPGVTMVAPDIEAPFAGAAASAGALPQGSGNLNIRSNRAHAVSALTLELMQTLQRVRANLRAAAKASRKPAALKAVRPAAKHAAAPVSPAAKTAPALSGLGGAAASRGVLGGPAPLAASLDGTAMRRKF